MCSSIQARGWNGVRLVKAPRRAPSRSSIARNVTPVAGVRNGADDFDLPIEDEVTQKAGATIDLDLESLLAVPRSLGYEIEYRHAERPNSVAAAGGTELHI